MKTDSVCPHCKKLNDEAFHPEGKAEPEPGDVSLCVYCGEWGEFDKDLLLRVPSDDKYIELGKRDVATTIRQAWVKYFDGPR